jgi:hypothetical protein
MFNDEPLIFISNGIHDKDLRECYGYVLQIENNSTELYLTIEEYYHLRARSKLQTLKNEDELVNLSILSFYQHCKI